jgi:hypothetical protein
MMQNRRVVVLIVVILFMNLLLAIIFRDFIRENVLIPILYLFWYIRLFLRSLGEICLWPIILMILGIISLAILRKSKKPEQEDRGYTEATAQVEEGRVGFWMKYIRRQSIGTENLSFASFRMKELVLSVLAYQENLSNAELESEMDLGNISVPEELRNIVLSTDHDINRVSRPASLKNRVLRWFRSSSNSSQSPHNPEMDKLVRYLEAQLEIEHDDGNH